MNVADPFHTMRTASAGSHVHPGSSVNLMSVSTWATRGLIILFVTFILLVAAFSTYGRMHADRVYEGIYVGDVNASGMNRDELSQALDDRLHDYGAQQIMLTSGDREFPVALSSLGISFDQEATIQRVMSVGRTGTWWDRSLEWTSTWIHHESLSVVTRVDPATLDAQLAAISSNVLAPPQNATISMQSSNGPTLVDDVDGASFNRAATRSVLLDQVSRLSGAPVPLALVSVPAEVQSADISGGLAQAQQSVAGSMALSSKDGAWWIPAEDMTKLVWVDDQGELQVRKELIESTIMGIAEQIDHPSQDAGITVDESGQFLVVPGVISATVDVSATTDLIESALRGGGDEISLVVDRQVPTIGDEVAHDWAGRADKLVGDGMNLTWSGESLTLGRGDLIAALVIEPRPGDDATFALSFDRNVLAERIQPMADELDKAAVDARFRLVNGKVTITEQAQVGREMHVDASLDAIQSALGGGSHESRLVVSDVKPTYSRVDQANANLPDVLGESNTSYANSSDPRRHNVERAVDLEEGWLVPPDGVFSYAEVMGVPDEKNGFVTGYGIVANESGGVTTAPVVGGGICQVSTTIFQSAWWAGLPIVERYAHPYWLTSYGQAPYGMKGLDAMVNIEPDWAIDLKFRNTTGNWILIEMMADGETVTSRILGVDPGWTVQVDEPKITNVVTPKDKMLFTDSPELPKGEELQVESAQEGFDSSITRTVKDSKGNVVLADSLDSKYSASQNTTLRGTGADN